MPELNTQKIIIKNLQKRRIPISKEEIIRLTKEILEIKHLKDFGLSILFVNEEFIRSLNLKYLKRKSSTDVLAFPLGENPENFLGDIVISIDSAIKNSSIFKTSIKKEICLYLIHGILHFLGFKDKKERERKIMESEQKRILKILKI